MSIRWVLWALVGAALLVRSPIAPPLLAQQRQPARAHTTWSDYGSGPDSSKFVAFDQITKANVGQLKVAWTYYQGASIMNPVIVDGIAYVYARNSSLVALDAATGEPRWIHTGLAGIASQGINYWESPDRSDRRLILQINHSIQEVDARTGRSILTFGKNGLVDLRAGLGRDPNSVARIKSDTPGRVFENLIILGSSTGENFLAPPGDIRAYDARTGAVVWQFHTIPQPGEFGYDTWPKDAWRYAGGVNSWGEMSIDERRAIVYVTLGSPTYDMYGGDRPGTNLFGNCLLALDARTGRRIWHFQTVHHDLWDQDLASAPQLITIRPDGRMIDAVAVAGKTGFLYVFNRLTGDPIWPIEERPVPQSDVPGEQAWPTQPFPTAPPPFARQRLTIDDLNPFFLSPAEHAQWRTRVANARNEGLFTPPAYQRDTVQIPGARGGSNRGTTAADPDKGLVFVTTQDYPSLINIEGPELGRGAGGAAGAGRGAATDPGQAAYQQYCQACHGADRSGIAPAPSLVGVTARLSPVEMRLLVSAGRGQMAANPGLDAATLSAIYGFLAAEAPAPVGAGRGGGAGGRGATGGTPPDGPIVASGGAPGGLEPALNEAQLRAMYGGNNRFVGPPYPSGVAAPTRLYSDYGLVQGIVAPPWSQIVAYDLNTGTIKWKKPLGEDELAVQAGGSDTGMLAGGERVGMVVTATGLVFATAKDGRLRAFDEDTGAIVWSFKMPGGAQGIPAMYEVGGRQYLIVSSTASVSFGRSGGRGAGAAGGAAEHQGWIAFALPAR